MAGSRDDADDDGGDDDADEGYGDDAEGGRGLDAAYGGSDGNESGGPLPTEEDAAAAVDAQTRGDEDDEPAFVDRVTVVLVRHRTAFTVATLAYGLLAMPWLYQNGYEGIGLAGGLFFLGGIVLVTVANAQAARERVRGSDERRGF